MELPDSSCAQRPECNAKLFGKQPRLLPRREVTAFVEPVVMDQFWIRALRPAPRGRIKLVREDAYGNRDGDAFDIEIAVSPKFPIEPGARERRVRQPCDRDVVEDVVARQ